ncbi:MAG: linear amide C-N hydrolase [Methylococcales bacterium]
MCTNFSLFSTGNNSNYAISARTMDFAQDLNTSVCVVPRGQSFPAIAILPEHNPVKWTNQYGYVGMQANIDNAIHGLTDGMNEAGLSIGELWLPCSEYPTSKSATNPVLYNINLIDWVLGNFDSVQSLKTGLTAITIVNINERYSQARVPTHFAVSDSDGNNIIIEFMNGAMQVYDSPNGVMTNAPPYNWQLDNLSTYVNLSLTNNPKQFWGQELNGSGLLGMPGDYSAPSRFIRAWMLQQSTQNYTPQNTEEAVGLAARILQNFATPMGSVMEAATATGSSTNNLDRTQWGVIRDQKQRVYYFFTQFNNNLFSVDLQKIDFGTVKASATPAIQPVWHNDITDTLI